MQLGDDLPSHILVPAIHRNRAEIREIFLRTMAAAGRPAPDDLTDEPARLAEAARLHLREKFLRAKVGVSGANFAVADTGTLVVVESEGNGRMCLTLPEVLVSVVGIEKVVPTWADLDVFLQLLPRSSTGERMNPYTSTWSGVTPGDGPQEVHVVLLDNGRTRALADEVGRQALRCIRCSACLNVCPVYERTGGHAYGSVYPGPIGAILNPLLKGVGRRRADRLAALRVRRCAAPASRPARCASTSPSVLVDLRAQVVDAHRGRAVPQAGGAGDEGAPRWRSASGGAARRGRAGVRPGRPAARPARPRRAARRPARCSAGCPDPAPPGPSARDLPLPPAESFRAWWKRTDRRRRVSERPRRDPRPGTAGAGRRRHRAGARPARLPRRTGAGADARRPVRRAGRGLPGRRRALRGPTRSRPRIADALPGGARVVVPDGLPWDGPGRRRRRPA